MIDTDTPELIVMLTHADRTVDDALGFFRSCEGVGLTRWGFKDVGLPAREMRKLGAAINESGCSVYLEIVSLTVPEVLAAIDVAASCSCYAVMGSLYSVEAHNALREHGLRYLPFVGEVSAHPSVLDGSPERIVSEAEMLAAMGVDGIDLLTYRYRRGNAERLLQRVVAASPVPVVSAGSIASFDRIGRVWDARAWGFTIGSALFDGAFDAGGSFRSNVASVADWLQKESARRQALERNESRSGR